MRNHAAHALFLAATLLASCPRNTSAQIPTAFDNTSITPANEKVGKLLELSNDTIAAAQITLPDLLQIEFGGRIVGLTDEQQTTHFDVTGKIDPPGVSDPVHNPKARAFTLDALLKNHFHMKAHDGMVDVTTEHLIVGGGGIKFTPAPTPVRCPCPRPIRTPNSHINSGHLSMSSLAHLLSDEFHIGVVDSTGLQGTFVIDLDWLSKLNVTPQTTEQVLRPALETHLGLTLAPTRSQEKATIVDYIEIPASVIWLPQNPDSAQTALSSPH
jgi:uncharacterized protein (TIGR03435 family)